MHLLPVTSSPAPLAAPYGGEPGMPVGVMLLGVRVTAYAIINTAEHQRRDGNARCQRSAQRRRDPMCHGQRSFFDWVAVANISASTDYPGIPAGVSAPIAAGP